MGQTSASDSSSQSRVLQHWSLFTRSCLIIVLLVAVILPAAGLGLAVWLFLVPTAPEAEAMRAYRSAPACTELTTNSCVRSELAVLISVFSTPRGKLFSRTDTLTLRLADGVHETSIYYDIFAPDVYYAPIGGQLPVREFRGRVTSVYTSNGNYETGDSPIGGSTWRGGAVAALVIVCAPILLIALVLLRTFGLKSMWRLLRNPNRPLPSYPDYITAQER